MTIDRPAEQVHLSVLRPGRPTTVGATIADLVRDGTAVVGLGTLLVGAVLAEAIKFIDGQPDASWWFLLLTVAGAALVTLGVWARHRHHRRMRVGLSISVFDPRRGDRGRVFIEQAENYARDRCRIALAVNAGLSGDSATDHPIVKRVAEYTIEAFTLAERLAPDASRVNLIPMMPLHVAFWLGAQLGHTHSREFAVYQVRQGTGVPPYFHATTLRRTPPPEPASTPLTVAERMPVVGVDSNRTALAVDVMNRGGLFLDPVKEACRAIGVGWVVPVSKPSGFLEEDLATFSAAVEQVCQAWRDAELPADARYGRHVIFLSTPVALALTLGARLAGPQPGAWTAYTLDPERGTYETFPSGDTFVR